jgi:hypothetical protein
MGPDAGATMVVYVSLLGAILLVVLAIIVVYFVGVLGLLILILAGILLWFALGRQRTVLTA